MFIAGEPLWNLNRATDPAERAEEEKLLEIRLETRLRSVFHECATVLLSLIDSDHQRIVDFPVRF